MWVKLSHEEKGKPGAVRYWAESPDSDRVEAGCTLVRRNRKHIGRVSPEVVEEPPGILGTEVNRARRSECVHSGDNGQRRSGRARRGTCKPMYVYDYLLLYCRIEGER